MGVFLYLWASCFPAEQLKGHTFQLYAINFVVRTGYRPRPLHYGTMDKIRKLVFEAESQNRAVSGKHIFTALLMLTLK